MILDNYSAYYQSKIINDLDQNIKARSRMSLVREIIYHEDSKDLLRLKKNTKIDKTKNYDHIIKLVIFYDNVINDINDVIYDFSLFPNLKFLYLSKCKFNCKLININQNIDCIFLDECAGFTLPYIEKLDLLVYTVSLVNSFSNLTSEYHSLKCDNVNWNKHPSLNIDWDKTVFEKKVEMLEEFKKNECYN